ncbi:hypothetical protein S245_066436, partial [Arachis hypogaea]
LYSAYSSTALTHSHTHTSSLSYEMPLLPDDSETCVNDLENTLKVRGIQLKRPNETCDVVFCFCGIRLHPLSCPDAFSVNENGELVGDKTVRRLEKNCISRTDNVNGFPGLGGCSKCLNTLYRLSCNVTILHAPLELVRFTEVGCKEMRTSGLLLKFLKAILKAGNRMNAGTSRGNAQGFNLSALRKLPDVKSIDRKTSGSEGRREAMNQKHNIPKINGDISNSNENNNSLVQHETEKEYLMLGLQVLLGGIKDELSEVKKAAIIDHQNFIRMLYILNARVSEIREIVTKCCGENNERGGFVKEMKGFVEECEEELKVVKDEHLRIMELVKKTNEFQFEHRIKGGEAKFSPASQNRYYNEDLAPPFWKKEVNQLDLPNARLQCMDQWLPVYSWLETLDKDDVVKSKDIFEWLIENPKILKRKKKKKGIEKLEKDTLLMVHKDVAMKHASPVP